MDLSFNLVLVLITITCFLLIADTTIHLVVEIQKLRKGCKESEDK